MTFVPQLPGVRCVITDPASQDRDTQLVRGPQR